MYVRTLEPSDGSSSLVLISYWKLLPVDCASFSYLRPLSSLMEWRQSPIPSDLSRSTLVFQAIYSLMMLMVRVTMICASERAYTTNTN